MPKRILEGVVVSDKGDKTIIVKVERTFLHPVLKKTVRRSKRYHAHDEANAVKTGEIVKIVVVRRDPALTEEALLAHCRLHLTGYKLPKVVEFRTEPLPKSNLGKVLRRRGHRAPRRGPRCRWRGPAPGRRRRCRSAP